MSGSNVLLRECSEKRLDKGLEGHVSLGEAVRKGRDLKTVGGKTGACSEGREEQGPAKRRDGRGGSALKSKGFAYARDVMKGAFERVLRFLRKENRDF